MSWFDKAMANAGVDKRDDYGQQAIEREQNAKQEPQKGILDTLFGNTQSVYENSPMYQDIRGFGEAWENDTTDNINNRAKQFDTDTYGGSIASSANRTVANIVGGAADMLGMEKFGDRMNTIAKAYQDDKAIEPALTWEYITSPHGLTRSVTEAATSSATLAPTMALLPESAALSIAARLGGNKGVQFLVDNGYNWLAKRFAQALPWGVRGATMALPESIVEGGGTVRTAKEAGLDDPYGRGWKTVAENLPGLVVSDFLGGMLLGGGALKPKPGASVLRRAATVPLTMSAEGIKNSGEEAYQQVVQNLNTDRPLMEDVERSAKEGFVGGLLPGFGSGVMTATNTNRFVDPKETPEYKAWQAGANAQQDYSNYANGAFYNNYLEQAQALLDQQNQEAQGRIFDEAGMQKILNQVFNDTYNQSDQFAEGQPAPTISAENSLDGFDSRYVSKWESKPGATDLANVQQSVKNNFNAAIAEYGDSVTLTGGAEKGYHAAGETGHEGGWKIDVDKASVKDPQKFLQAMAKYGFQVGDEGDHYDLSGHAKGGVGGTVVATPDSFVSDGGQSRGTGKREGHANAWAAYDVFRNAGYNDEAIAGILGRLQQEHNFDTSNVEEYDDAETGLHLGGYGMFQWNGGRTTAFLNWAQENNLDPQNPSVQAQYALIEAQQRGLTPERMNKLTAEEAADLWTDEWEVGKRGNERQYAAEWRDRIKNGGNAGNSTDISIPNTKVDTSEEDRAFDEYNKQLDELAEKGIEAPFKTEQPTQKELVQQAKESAIESGDMDEVQRINSAERSGNTEELAKIADKALKAKQKEAKGKTAPATPEIKMASPNLINQVKQLLNTAKEQGVKLEDLRIENTLKDGREETLQNFATMLQGRINESGYESRVAQGKQLLDYADEKQIDLKPGLRKMLREGQPKAIEAAQNLINEAQSAPKVQPANNVVQSENTQAPVQVESAQNQPTEAQRMNAKQEMEEAVLRIGNSHVDGTKGTAKGILNRALENKEYDTIISMFPDEITPVLKEINNKHNLPMPEPEKKEVIDYDEYIERTQGKKKGKEQPADEDYHGFFDDKKPGAVREGKKRLEEKINPFGDAKGFRTVKSFMERWAENDESNQSSTKGKSYYVHGNKVSKAAYDYYNHLVNSKAQQEEPVSNEDKVDKVGDKSEETKKAIDEEDEKKDSDNELSQQDNGGKIEVETEESSKPENKLQRMRRGREELEAVAKKYENGEITQSEAYSQVSKIAKDIATVPKEGVPNVTFIDGKMKQELTEYGDRLIDEAAEVAEKSEAGKSKFKEISNILSKYEKGEKNLIPIEDLMKQVHSLKTLSKEQMQALDERAAKIAEKDLKEVVDNEQQGESRNPAGGHSGVRTGESGTYQRGETGEVSERDGREGSRVHEGDGREDSEGPATSGVREGTELEETAGNGDNQRGNQPTVPLTEAEAHPSPTEIPGNDYEIKDTDQSTKSEKVRFKQNVDAIKMLKQLEADDRMPTPAEQEILGAYNGWGGLKGAFLDGSEMNKELRDLLTDDEYKAAQSTINDAFYTPPKLIRAIWEGISHLGFKGGRVLDPSMGVGNFFGTMPRDMMDKSALRGVELDNLTSRFAKMLYPSAFVENKGFQKASVADNYYDLAISNIPFGQNMINGYQVHNYFFANGIDKVRPGGLMVYITSQGSLAGGKDAAKMRNYLENHADLIAAYKLPSGVFSDAGTQVATDIVIFRKRDKDGKKSPYGQKFGDVKEVKVGQGYYAPSYSINEYFVAHKENILGEQSTGRDQWGNTALNVKMAEGTTVADVANDLSKAMQKLPTDVYQPVSRKKSKSFDTASAQKKAAAAEKTRDYEYYYKDGKPVQNQNGQEVELTGQKAKVVNDYLKVKNTLNALFAAESDPKAKTNDVEGLRKKLNKDYDAFVAKHGSLTGTAAKNYADDPSAGMVQALEKPVKGGKKGAVEKADIFTTRSIKAVQEVTHVETADDALIASLTNRGTVDLDYMAELTNSKPETLISKLKGKLFKNPATEDYETRDEYLSGNVRQKLAQAKEAAKSDKAYADNVKELEKVIPEDLVSDEIFVNLGTPWIPVQDVQAFVDTLADNVHVSFSRGAALWTVTGWGRSAKYKLNGIDFPSLLNHVLNNKAIQIYDGSGDNKVFNQEKTDAANVAAEELQQEFKDWIWKDKDREKRLVKYYNENYNNTVVRQYDGQHLNLHSYGMNAKIELKPHQKDVVWRMLQGGNTLIAHCVGAGKTFEMQAAGMEMRRLGIANKPMYCLPNNVVEQFAREFRQLYPNAKLLVLQSKDLPAVEKTSKLEKTEDGRTKRVSLLEGKTEAQKTAIMEKRTARNRMLNRIRTEDWDGIIISHNLFQRFPVTPETAADFIQQEIDTLEQTIREAKQDRMDSRALSNLETSKKNLQERLEEVISTDIEDIGVPFEELGIDQLFVDEADMFKNLAFATRLGNIRGLSNSKANRSQDMFLKTQWLTNNMDGRGVVFATGTPVSNTMSELYTMMRYLDMKGLKEKGLEVFDNWMRTFGDIGQGIERKPTGDGFRKVTMIKRFINMAELTKMFRSFADVKVQDELNLDIPKLKNDKSTVIALEPDAKVVNYIKNVVPERVKKMKSGFKKEKGEDNMLSLTNDLRKLSLTDSKIEACADAIAKKYHETADVKGTQLVFCDMGIPKAESDKAGGEETAKISDVESPEVYRTLIAKLKEKGIPDKDVAFIQNYNTKTKRDNVFQKVNEGEVRILIGSTETMGAGTNCQKHLVALHDLDAPWRPRDLEQRHGRILRQGNENKQVEIFNYVVKDSFDANMWEKLKNKAAIIQQAMSGDMNMRTVEDADLVTLSYAEVEGAATGNPLIKEQLQVQNDLTKYQHAQTAFRKKVRDAENTLAGSEESIAEQEKVIAKIEKDIAQRKDTKGDKFSMQINGKAYKDRTKADEALANILRNYKQQKTMDIGQIGGFRLTALYKPEGEVLLQLVNNRAYAVQTNSVAGIENTLRNGPDKSLEYRQKDLNEYKEQVAQAQEIVQQENPYAEKVKQLSDRLNQLNREIADTLVDDGKQKVAQAEDTSIDSEPETEVKEPAKGEKSVVKESLTTEQETKENAPADKSTANVNVDEFEHTKTGKMIPAASLKDHVDKDFRKQATAIAKNHGGKWSPFAKRILFKTEQGRDDFVREVEALLSVTNPESSGAIEVKFSQEGWHGSKYHFDKFDVAKIGTGEGAQAHGYGLYIAGNRKVSEGYRDKLSEYSWKTEKHTYTQPKPNSIVDESGNEVDYSIRLALTYLAIDGNKNVAIESLLDGINNPTPYSEPVDESKKAIDWLKKNDVEMIHQGALYQVEIPDSDVLLDEQKSLKKQPEKVQKAIRDILQNEMRQGLYSYREENGEYILYKGEKEIDRYDDEDAVIQAVEENNEEVDYQIEKAFSDIENKWGQTIYKGLSTMLGGDKEASELLNKYGIKGITYEGGLDGRCFVIFDDQAIEIINKFSVEGEIRRAVKNAKVVDTEDLTSQQRKMSEFGEQMGTPVLWISADPKLHGFHSPNGITVLNVRSNMDLSKTFWHEAFHWVAGNNEALYNELLDYFKGKSAFSPKQLEAYRKRIGRPGMSDELTIEEMLADNFEEVKDRVKIFKEMGAEQPSLARKFVAWVKRIMDKFAEFFHNPEGKLTTAQRDSFVKAFGRLARDMKDGNGRPLFKVYKEGKEIRLTNGQLVTEGIKLSAKNDIDKHLRTGHNRLKKRHEGWVTNRVEFVDGYPKVDLLFEFDVKEDSNTTMERRKQELYFIDGRLGDDYKTALINILGERKEEVDHRIGISSANEAIDAYRTRFNEIIEMPVGRSAEEESNIITALALIQGGIEYAKTAPGYNAERDVRFSFGQRENEVHARGNQSRGRGLQSDNGRYGLERADNQGKVTTKHSEKGAFSNGKTKYSYSASDNSNEGLFHKIKNIMSGKASEDSEKFRYRKHLTEMIEKALDVKLRYGKMDGKKDVVYKPENRVLRSRHAFDWENILPVAGRIAAEQLEIEPTESMNNYIADWILTGAPNNVSKEADTFHKAMREHPANSAKLEDLRDAFAEWLGKDYREQMQRTIQWKNKQKTTMQERKNKFYEEFVEELEPINRMVKQVNANLTEKGQSKLGVSADPMIAFRMLRGSYGRAMTALEGVNDGAVDALKHAFPNVDFTGFKTLYQILKSIDAFQNAEKQRDFVTYCTACHIMDMHQHNDDIRQEQQHLKNKIEKLGTSKEDEKQKAEYEKDIEKLSNEIMPIPATYSKENCQKYINDGYDKYHDAQQDLVHFSNTTAAMLADSGVISEKRFKELLTKWQNYVPLFRVFEDNEDINFGDSMKHIKGSTRDIVNPLESIIRNTAQFIQKAELNKAKCLLADVARCDASGWLLEEVDKSDSDKTTITFWENGQRKYLQTDPDIVRAVNNMGADGSHFFIKFLHAITRLARACFTMASPEFALRNVARDWQDATLYTKHGMWVNPLDIVRGFIHAWKKDDVFYEWLTQGAAQASALSLDRDYTQSTLDKLGRGYWKRLASKDFHHALLEGLQMAGEYSEYGTRIAMYQKTKAAILKDKPNATKQELHEAMLEAAFESRDLMDFARHGKAGAEYNKITAFANASIQGWDKLYRSLDFKNDPKRATKVAAKLVLYGALPAMMIFAMYHDDDWYKDAPNWLKETHWLFKFGDTTIRIPKAADMGIRFISNAVEKGLDEAYNKHPHKAKEYFLPMWDALPGMLPTSILPIIEIQANHSFFTDRPIIPQGQDKLPAKLQYGPYTTSLAKWIGETFDIAPRSVEHFVAGYTGTLGMAIPKAIDLVSGQNQQSLSLEEMPLIRGYLYPQFKSPQSVNDYYEKLNEQTKLKNEYKLTHKRPEGFDPALLKRLESAQKQLRKISKQEKSIIDNPKWSIQDKEVMQRNIQKKRIEIAKRALGTK